MCSNVSASICSSVAQLTVDTSVLVGVADGVIMWVGSASASVIPSRMETSGGCAAAAAPAADVADALEVAALKAAAALRASELGEVIAMVVSMSNCFAFYEMIGAR